jgi:hypothetical protein
VSVNGIISDPVDFSFVQPSFLALCPGESTTLKLLTPPDPTLNYQWSFSPSGFEDAKPLQGETNAELNIVSAQTNQTGYYALGWDFKNDIISSPYDGASRSCWGRCLRDPAREMDITNRFGNGTGKPGTK